MSKKNVKNSFKLKKFLNFEELVKKTNIPKLIKANPLDSAKKSISKFYEDYKKIKQREDLKKEKQIELEKQRLIKDCLLYTSPSPRD